jgi:hypothetical protein
LAEEGYATIVYMTIKENQEYENKRRKKENAKTQGKDFD